MKTNNIPALRPPYAELPPTFWEQHGGTVAISGVLGVAAVVALIWLASRPKPIVPIPPEVQARHALDALQGRIEDGAFLSELSQILRRYVIAAFGLPAGEFTTAEFCRVIGGNESLGRELASDVANFLERCDVKKFAPAASPEPLNALAQAREMFERAELRRLIQTEAIVKK